MASRPHHASSDASTTTMRLKSSCARNWARDHSSTVRPASGRYCFGVLCAIRRDAPAAGTTTHQRGEPGDAGGVTALSFLAVVCALDPICLARRRRLIEGFGFPDHAEIGAGPLLDRRRAFLQVLNFRCERPVALEQRLVLSL